MIKYRFNVAHDLERSTVEYQEETSLYSTESTPSSNETGSFNNSVSRAKTFIGEDLVRYRTLYNKRFSFWYFSKKNTFANYSGRFAFVNNSDITVAGITIPKNKGLIVDLDSNALTLDYNGKDIIGYKQEVTIELEVEKPLLYTMVPSKGYYFKHPVTGKPARIQFSSCPEDILSKKKLYPNAVHVGNGFGFYSDDRTDWNVVNPCYLTKGDEIAFNDNEIEFIKCVERQSGDWHCLGLPTVAEEAKYVPDEIVKE